MALRSVVGDSINAIAQRLFTAFEDGVAIDPLTAGEPPLTVDTAYAIQGRLLSLHAGRGRSVVGRKIGLTSKGIQQQLGVDSPDYGAILDAYVYPSGATVSLSGERMILPKIEAELAFVLGRPLRGPGVEGSRRSRGDQGDRARVRADRQPDRRLEDQAC